MNRIKRIVYIFFIMFAFASLAGCGQENNVSTSIDTNQKFTLYFVTNGGTRVDKQVIEYNGWATEPTAPKKVGYLFDGWYCDSKLTIEFSFKFRFKSDMYLYAKWKEMPKYTIRWIDGDGKTIETDSRALYGSTPTYDGNTPTKKATKEYTYTFTGWEPVITEVTDNATYTAQFSESIVKYKITWKNENGTVLGTSDVKYGETPKYEGEVPTKASDSTYSYKFSGWYPEVTAATRDYTYTARYSNTYRTYNLFFKNEDGSVLGTEQIRAGRTLSSSVLKSLEQQAIKENDDEYYYTFKCWSPNIDSNTYIYEDQEYIACYYKTELPYTFHFNLNGGECDTEIKDKKTNRLDKKDFHFDLHKGDKKFRGWLYDGKMILDSDGNVVNDIKKFKSDMTFVAVYENEYMVTTLSHVYIDSNYHYVEYYDLPSEIGYVTPSASYEGHSNVELVATASRGYKFKRWVNDSNWSTSNPYTYGLWEDDVVIKVEFEKASYNLSVVTNNNLGKVQIKDGTVTSSISKSVLYTTSVSLYAIPNDGAKFVGWYSDGLLVSSDVNYVFTMPYNNYSLEARFEEISE